MNYQSRQEEAEEQAAFAAQYIDEHERLIESEAFAASPDRSAEVLAVVWRIVQTRPATQSDEAVADIRSAILDLISHHAERYARMRMERKDNLYSVL